MRKYNNHLSKHHKLTHKALIITIISMIAILSVYGLSRVKATQNMYSKVENTKANICYKIGEDQNNTRNHVSCKNYEKVCRSKTGALVGCKSGILIY